MTSVLARTSLRGRAGFFVAAFLLTLLSGCKAQEPATAPTFHPLPALSYVYDGKDYSGKAYSVKNEVIVIAHPPADRKALEALVNEYNEKTLPAEQLAKQFGYIRSFYRESEKMPRDYRESSKGYFFKDHLEDHVDDLVITVKWEDFGKTRSVAFP